MYMKMIAAILLSSCSVFSATLECKVVLNLDIVDKSTVVTFLKHKSLIAEHSQIISYVTEMSPDFFSIEAFIPSLDTRIYSEGVLKNSDETLTATAWARDILADVICKKIK